jgi:hypothetical protein
MLPSKAETPPPTASPSIKKRPILISQPTHPTQLRPPIQLPPDHAYDVDRPQYLYSDNGDGSLYEVGLVGPGDIDKYGLIRGPRPAIIQINPEGLQAATITDHPYDTNRPQYLYSYNGDGTLFDVGIAGPSDIDEYGVIRGPRPSSIQHNPEVTEAATRYEFRYHPGYERKRRQALTSTESSLSQPIPLPSSHPAEDARPSSPL